MESEQILAKDMAKSAFRAILQLSGVVHGVLAGISLVFLVGIVLQMEDLSDGRADAFLTYW